MTDHDNTEDIDTDDRDQRDIRSLRKAAEEGATARAEAAELRRQLLFAKANIDWENDKLGKLLYKTWDGDSIDSLRNEAAELGIGRTPATENAEVAEQAAFRRNLSAGAPAGAVDPGSPDPRDLALSQFHEDVRRGLPREQAALAAFDRIFTAAVAGDERVIFNPDTWTQTAYR